MPRLSLLLSLLVAASASLASLAAAEDWPEFRGAGQQGQSQLTNLPVEWDIADATWKTTIPGHGWSSPVISNGRAYLTTAVAIGEEKVEKEGKFNKIVATPYSLRAVCVDCKTGETVWDVETAQVPEKTSIHPKNSHASSTSLVTNDRVFVHFGTYGTAALDLDGNIVWKKRIEYQPVHGSGGSLVRFQDLLIFNCDGGKEAFVIALDMKTGEERWRTPRPAFEGRKFSFSTPLLIEVDGRPQLVSCGSDFTCSYDPKTGDELWSVNYPKKWSLVARPMHAGGLVLICTGYEGPAELLAVRPDGEGDVTETHIAWREGKFVPYNPSPIVLDGHIFMVSDGGIATCRNLQTGELSWKERLQGAFSSSPITANGLIYFLSEEGMCTVIKANPEAFEEVAKNDTGERTFASLAPVDKGFLLRGEKYLYRIDN